MPVRDVSKPYQSSVVDDDDEDDRFDSVTTVTSVVNVTHEYVQFLKTRINSLFEGMVASSIGSLQRERTLLRFSTSRRSSSPRSARALKT